MQNSSLILLSLFAIGCSNPKIFVLNEKEESRYFVQRLVSTSFEKDLIGESPLVVINGTSFKYNKKQDTILLPLKKLDIITLDFLNKNSSRIIYNEKENDGAIIITSNIQK